jgi:antagonist of KipI
MLTVIKPGMLTTIQDGGRWGWQHLGVPVSGPMDPFSFGLANGLVGNDPNEAALEVTLKGPELRFDAHAVVAVTGADLSASLGGDELPVNEAVTVPAGSSIRFGERRFGARTYLAVRGGLDVQLVLGSRSASIDAGLPGLAGRRLQAGDRLPIGGRGRRPVPREIAVDLVRDRRRPAVLRVLPGPDELRFERSARDRFLESVYRIAPQSNRMGYRLEGAALQVRGAGQMLSEGTPVGSIQVPPSGDPILLMADRQTTGGYARIATVIAADLPIAGQLAPGEDLRFELCSIDDALNALRMQQAFLDLVSGSTP